MVGLSRERLEIVPYENISFHTHEQQRLVEKGFVAIRKLVDLVEETEKTNAPLLLALSSYIADASEALENLLGTLINEQVSDVEAEPFYSWLNAQSQLVVDIIDHGVNEEFLGERRKRKGLGD